jgi:hypothetical protein
VHSARDVARGLRLDLEIVDETERVPAVMLIPASPSRAPAALLLHGFGSRKERMIDTIGDALLSRNIAALAVDLPLHGARGNPRDLRVTIPTELRGGWQRALRESRLALDFLAGHERVDRERLGLVGYSLGSFLANIVAAETPAVRAVVLAASGDLPDGLPFESLVRAVLDPLRVVRLIAGRPLMMINGRFDRTVRPSQAERLFAAAAEPKTMRWYGGGHWPPEREIDHAAAWLSQQLMGASPASSRTPRTRASSGG